jgi:hypothetical protein
MFYIQLTLHKDGVLAGGGSQSQLVKGDDLSSSLDDASSSSLSHSQSANLSEQKSKLGLIGKLYM